MSSLNKHGLVELTDDFPRRTAAVDELLSCAELRGETAADESVKNAVTSVRHHWRVTSQFVPLQSYREKIDN